MTYPVFGKVSLTEVIPIMSAMGIEVCPLPDSSFIHAYIWSLPTIRFVILLTKCRLLLTIGITFRYKNLTLFTVVTWEARDSWIF